MNKSLDRLQVGENKKQLFRAVYELNEEQCEALIRRVEQMKLTGIPQTERDEFIEQFVKSLQADNIAPPLVYGAEPLDIGKLISRPEISDEHKRMLAKSIGRRYEELDNAGVSAESKEAIQRMLDAEVERHRMAKLDTIGKRCKHARRSAGLNLVEAGRKLRLSHKVLDQYERDEVTPSQTRQWIMAQGYNVSDEWLAGETQEIGTFELDDLPVGCRSVKEMILDPALSFVRDALCDIVDFEKMRKHADFPPEKITAARERYGYEIDITTLIELIKQDAAPTAMKVNPIQKYTHDSKEGEPAC